MYGIDDRAVAAHQSLQQQVSFKAAQAAEQLQQHQGTAGTKPGLQLAGGTNAAGDHVMYWERLNA